MLMTMLLRVIVCINALKDSSNMLPISAELVVSCKAFVFRQWMMCLEPLVRVNYLIRFFLLLKPY
jgi:hypothetical protein